MSGLDDPAAAGEFAAANNRLAQRLAPFADPEFREGARDVAATVTSIIKRKGRHIVGSYLSRERILAAKDVKTEEVHVPEWADPETGADTVLVRAMTGKQRDWFEASILERRGKTLAPNTANIRARVVAYCVVDGDGERMFTDADAEELGEHSAAALDRVYEVASRLSGLSDEDLDEMAEKLRENPFGGGSSSSANGQGGGRRRGSPSGAAPS